MTLVLLVLAGIWAAVLIPPAVRRRAEGRPGDSISNFRRQLTVLRRTGPHRGSLNGSGRPAGGDHWYRTHASAPALAPVPRPLTSSRSQFSSPQPARPRPVRTAPAPSAARSRTIRRRRDVLSALVVAVLATLVLGLLPAFRVMLYAHVVADVLLAAYVALLVHQRNVAAEREMKVRFLPQARRLEPALLRTEPALLRRSANQPVPPSGPAGPIDRSAELAALGDAARTRLDAANAAREVALAACRRTIRACGSSIRAVHLLRPDDALRLADEAGDALREAQGAMAPYPALAGSGPLHDAAKEYAEARLTAAMVGDHPLPSPDDLEVPVAAWLNGLAEAASELRRHLLDRLRQGDLSRGETLLATMDEAYGLLVTMDYPDAVSGGLRRTTDALRAVLERTRGDLTTTILQARLQAALDRRATTAD